MLVVGTRPEAIKLAPLAGALLDRGITPIAAFTGQHPLDPASTGFGCCPVLHLGCPAGGEPYLHVQTVSLALQPLIRDSTLVIVQGDTSSAFGGAAAARLASIPVAHVEAGLRTHDRRRPWPEEDFRRAIDAASQLLFAPTELAAANLRRERATGQIHVTGNTGVDAVLRAREQLPAGQQRRDSHPRLLLTCHRRESWGPGIARVATALRRIAVERLARVDLLLHPNPACAANMRALVLGVPGIHMHEPAGHAETVAAMIAADCVLSDSGGMQEECAALGVPLLVLRDRTERPEAIACGSMALVGTDPERIVSAVRRLVSGCGRAKGSAARDLPYGDGTAARRIASIIENWLDSCSDHSDFVGCTGPGPLAQAPMF